MRSEPNSTNMVDKAVLDSDAVVSSVEKIEDDLTGTLQEHWRKGIPTLVLLVFAIALSSYYSLIVKPGIQDRYSNTISSNLKAVGLARVDEIESSGRFRRLDTDMTLSKRIELLKETQLSLRRFGGWNQADDSVHFRFGIVSNELEICYREQAKNVQAGETRDEQYSKCMGQAKNERQNAQDAMERVRKIGGTLSGKASLWLSRRHLEENSGMTVDELSLIEETVRGILEKESSGSLAKLTLGQVLIEKSLRLSSNLDLPLRVEMLGEADDLLQFDATSDLRALTWAAEARFALDPASGQDIANKVLQEYWATRETETHSIESLSAIFRCFLIINSIKEGQVFLSEQLQQLSLIDQSGFRVLTAASALRHVVSSAILPASKGLDLVLSMAVQLNPESLELSMMLEKLATSGIEYPIVVSLRSELGLGGTADGKGSEAAAADGTRRVPATLDVGIRSLFVAVNGFGRGEKEEATTRALEAALKVSPAYGVAVSRLLVHMEVAKSVSSRDAIRWLQTINKSAPEVLVAWADRAKLHLKYKQTAEAIECYEYLHNKLPGNEQIKEALDAARKQSSQ